jgi:ferredoxin
MKLEVDWTRCDGHGLCAELLPSRIILDEWGFPIIDDSNISRADETAARRAASVCPALALRLVDSRPTR